jgi:hypothetical protein
MGSSHNPGRVAGFLYLLLGFSVFRPIFIVGKLIVRDNATATARNIATHELLFRAGIVTDLLAGVSCIFVALALYQLLKDVDRRLAALMVILGGLMPCAIDLPRRGRRRHGVAHDQGSPAPTASGRDRIFEGGGLKVSRA